MNALDRLSVLLQVGTQKGANPMHATLVIDDVLSAMRLRAKSNATQSISEDHLLEAVRRFWESQEVSTFKDAYLLSWGLSLPYRPSGPCILEDRPRLQRVLDGVDTWNIKPAAYRRCYQGLIKNYFTYDAFVDSVSPAGRNNWKFLRDYLFDRHNLIRDSQVNPEWVDTVMGNRQLFGDSPFEPYVDTLFRGDAGAIDHFSELLGIGKASWFFRELLLAQVRGACKLGNEQFKALMPRLLELLAGNIVLRDRGLALILNRYVTVPGMPLNQELREAAVKWWGNPWLPSNETRWGAVVPDARTMVADWLKLEFIETFFTKLAEDGLGDRRRMEFWKRYVKAIQHIEFALGSTARNSREKDFVVLRDKMKGLIRNLDASGTNNAFIMRIGDLVAVEFSGIGNALYGYDARKSLPFDTTRLLRLTVDASNSLKHKAPGRVLWMSHQDGIRGWGKWEQMLEATMKEEFGIVPNAAYVSNTSSAGRDRASNTGFAGRDRASNTGSTGRDSVSNSNLNSESHSGNALPYSRTTLDRFANARGLRIEDNTAQGGSLWVRTGSNDTHISGILNQWGFRYKDGKGWWK